MHGPRYALALPLCVALGCATPASETEPSTNSETVAVAEPLKLEFAWPAPVRAVVEEEVEKKGNLVKMRYLVTVEAEGDRLHVQYGKLHVLEYNGQPIASVPKGDEIKSILVRAMAAMPTIVADQSGEFVGVTGLERAIDMVLELEGPSADGEAIAQAMRSPEMLSQLEQAVGDIWQGWAGVWAGLELPPGQVLEFEWERGAGSYRIVNFDDDTVSVELRTELDPEQLVAETKAMLRTMAAEMGDDPAEVDRQLANVTGSKVSTYAATLRRDTLLPLTASRVSEMSIEIPGEPAQAQREAHHYTFTWQNVRPAQ